ncbi:DrmB family protein [Sorangium sp. So ce1024]|uniref:DrmB family protein n=1 Tax=Sorangium sp. So ce1024 TaxID=3133327 RepID=UPI003EFEC290
MMKPRGPHAPRVQQQPDGTIRQSQVVTTFGPGSMVDLLNDAVLIGGLDFWSYDKSYAIPHIPEPRLRDAIVERFQQVGRELSAEYPFRAPPVGNDREPSRFAGIQVLEFPQWFVCQNASCRALLRKDGLELKSHRYWHRCTRSDRAECVPVRFVMACKKGHADEFAWIAFVHEAQQRPRCAAPSLTFEEGPTGDFNDIRVACACGGAAPLSLVLGGLKLHCRGERPWLGPEGREECKETAKLLVRTASNSYFPQVVSALSIPDPSGEVRERVQGAWDVLKSATKENLPIFRQIEKVRIALEGLTDAEVMEAVKALQSDRPATQGPIRTAEYRQLTASKQEAPGELPPTGATFFAREVAPKKGLPNGIRKLVVAPKLREVVAQIGFTRLEPVTPDVQGEYDLGVQTAALGLTTNWLPASEIRGEGVFIELDEAAVREWEDRACVKDERARALEAGHDAWARTLDHPPPFPGVRFYMLHTLAHLLMSAISLECGYASSALRERIYCGPSHRDPTPMAAILLSTGTSGTEGTLGGLVEQGRQLRAHLQRAFDLGRLCSNDPVCGTHSPENDHAERHLEGAACHGCLFVAECSCERFNRYLDRALVVPTLGHPAELAFFSTRP